MTLGFHPEDRGFDSRWGHIPIRLCDSLPMHGSELEHVVQLFVEQHSTLLNLRPKTVKNKRNAMNRFMAFLRDKPFTLENTRAYLDHLFSLNWEPLSVKTELKILRAFGAYCLDEEYIDKNFAKKIKSPKIPRKMREVISEENAERVIEVGTEIRPQDNLLARHIKREMRVGLRFMLRTGLRVTEVLDLRGEDLHLDAELPIYYVHSKGGAYEPLPMPRDMISDLRTRKNQKKVFQITAAGCNRALKRGCEKLNLPIQTNHSIRNVYSLSRLRKGEALQKVSRTLRHSKIATTDAYYSHYLVDDLDVVVQNSNVINSGVSLNELFTRAIQAINHTGISRHKIAVLEQTQNNDELIIKIRRRL